MDTQSPLSTFEGQRAAIRAVTKSHGVIRPNMVDAVDFSRALTVTRVPEYDNETDALIFSTFDGANGRMAYTQSNQGQVEALLMDADPAVAQILVDPAKYQPFQLFANLKGQDGNVKGSWLVHSCSITGNPVTGTIKEGQKGVVEFEAINAFELQGLQLLYTRATNGVAPQGPPAQPALATLATGGALSDDTYYVRITAVTPVGESTASNEAAIELTVGTAVQLINVTLPALSGSVTGHNVYISNRSNDERFVGTSATTLLAVTALPSPTSAKVPSADTTGVYVASGDKTITAESITLDNAAHQFVQNGLDYLLILKNGVVVASPNKVADTDDFFFNAAGTTFNWRNTPTDTDVWELFTAFQP